MAVKYLGDGGSEGSCLGRSASDKVAFYGATPIAKQATTLLGALTAGATTAADIAAALVDLRDALVDLGIVSNT